MAVTWEHPRLARQWARGAAAALLVLTPPAIIALPAGFDAGADRTAVSWLTALAAACAYAVQRRAGVRRRARGPRGAGGGGWGGGGGGRAGGGPGAPPRGG